MLSSNKIKRQLNSDPKKLTKITNSYFFRLTHDQLKLKIYLLGSMPLISFRELPTDCQSLVEQADVLIAGRPKNSILSGFDGSKCLEKDELDWHVRLNNKQKKLMDEIFNKYVQYAPNLFSEIRLSDFPVKVASVIAFLYNQLGGMDDIIFRMFHRNKKPIYYLDDKATQGMTKISYGDEQNDLIFLIYRLQYFEYEKNNQEKINDNSLCDDNDEILKELRKKHSIFEKYRLGTLHCYPDLLNLQASYIKERNKIWIETILKTLNEINETVPSNKSLITCWAGHLFGSTGLLKLLGERGFTIEKIKPVNFVNPVQKKSLIFTQPKLALNPKNLIDLSKPMDLKADNSFCNCQ